MRYAVTHDRTVVYVLVSSLAIMAMGAVSCAVVGLDINRLRRLVPAYAAIADAAADCARRAILGCSRFVACVRVGCKIGRVTFARDQWARQRHSHPRATGRTSDITSAGSSAALFTSRPHVDHGSLASPAAVDARIALARALLRAFRDAQSHRLCACPGVGRLHRDR